MERHLHQSLDQIRQDLLRMGAEVEKMLAESIRALVERDNEIANAVRAADQEVDRLEKVIDEECSRILATQQPTAVDLRFIVAVMKITNDLERVGDCAVSVAKSTRKVNAEPPLGEYTELSAMAEMVGRSVRDGLDALVRKDAGLALDVRGRDSEVDVICKRVFKRMTRAMGEQPEAVSRALHLLLIARNYERIGDHATNIAEDVIYFVEGRDIRHPSVVDEPKAARTS
jgi:phosphate transport system protein